MEDDSSQLALQDIEPAQEMPDAMNGELIAFDELFEKFCQSDGDQFAYFDDCWSRNGKKNQQPALMDGSVGESVPPEPKEPAVEKPRKPLFDFADLDKPVKPIEMEPAHKHQLSEHAALWQLHKDVPPYMIDRITMPSWPTWSKYDFACLGLRPHLMLKLVRKPQPQGDGPHSFFRPLLDRHRRESRCLSLAW